MQKQPIQYRDVELIGGPSDGAICNVQAGTNLLVIPVQVRPGAYDDQWFRRALYRERPTEAGKFDFAAYE